MKLREPDRIETNAVRMIYGKHVRLNTKDADNSALVRACWDKFAQMGVLDELKAMASPEAGGFTAVCTNFSGSSYDYWIGVEVEIGSDLPRGYEKLVAVKAENAWFKCTGPARKAVADMWSYLYTKWLPLARYNQTTDMEFEFYPFGDMESPDYVSWIYFPVKRAELPGADTRNRGSMNFGSILAPVAGAVLGGVIAPYMPSGADNLMLCIIGGGVVGYIIYIAVKKGIKGGKKGKTDTKEPRN